jgi:hypothetical protein
MWRMQAAQGFVLMRKHSIPERAEKQAVEIARADGKVIGEVRNRTFQKHIRGSVHLLREPRAVGFDISALRDAERAGADGIAIFDDETGNAYRATFRHFWRKSFSVRRGHGDQVAMRLSEFNKPDDAPTPSNKPVQPSLFNLNYVR